MDSAVQHTSRDEAPGHSSASGVEPTGAAVTIQASWRPGVIDLGPGHPSDDLLPLELMRAAADALLAGEDRGYLQYGEEPGDESFRSLLAATIEAESGVATDPANLFVTAGASQALDILCTLYTRPGQTVLVAEPTYFLALEVFRDRGLTVVPLPCDEDGPVLAALEAALAGHQPALVYLVPSFGNPTGVTLSDERQRRVVELTAPSGALLVADEVYRFLQFHGAPPASLAGEGRPHVVALNSFSKVLAPGLRLGWFAGPSAVLQRIAASGFLRSGGGLNPFVAALVGQLLASGQLVQHVRWLRAEYAKRAKALTEALRVHAPQLEFRDPAGGYFVWASLPGADPARLREAARQHGVDYAPGAAFSSEGRFADHLRLSFSHYSPAELAEGARRLGAAVQSELATR